MGSWWNVHNCGREKGVMSCLASSLCCMKEIRSLCQRIRLSKVCKRSFKVHPKFVNKLFNDGEVC